MHSYEGRATILVGGVDGSREATVVIDDITSATWVGIVLRLDDPLHPDVAEGQVVLRDGPFLGAAARVMVPLVGLPTLRGSSRFTHQSASCSSDA